MPSAPNSKLNLQIFQNKRRNNDHISKMKKILKKNNFEDDQKESKFLLHLVKAYDDLKDSEMAIKFLSLGNKFMKKKEKSNINEEINIINRYEKHIRRY